jgi:pyrroline-5-carboxylate reductase
MIGCGATALFANSYVSNNHKNLAETLLRSVGITVWIQDEISMDAVTALSGSGPAYFFLVIEALQKAGEQLGLTPETARLLTLQTAYGAARMALESDLTAKDLRKNVTSPHGTTEAAIRSLENENIFAIFNNALEAAALRARELGSMKNDG